MKKVALILNETQRTQLRELQHKGSDLLRERSLAILHRANGKTLTWIANALHRRIFTIRSWISAYRKNGIAGLQRAYSSGRPSVRKQKLKPLLQEYLQHPPSDYGWKELVWTVEVLRCQFQKVTGATPSISTVERLLKDEGYSFKRPKKTIPACAPSKEDKLQRVQAIAKEIEQVVQKGDAEILFLDESHFSTEPYVVRGWYKRGEPFFPQDPFPQGKPLGVWRIRTQERTFLLEEYQ